MTHARSVVRGCVALLLSCAAGTPKTDRIQRWGDLELVLDSTLSIAHRCPAPDYCYSEVRNEREAVATFSLSLGCDEVRLYPTVESASPPEHWLVAGRKANVQRFKWTASRWGFHGVIDADRFGKSELCFSAVADHPKKLAAARALVEMLHLW